jgi:stage V sporulation protein R
MNLALEKRFEEIEVLARKLGLDPFPVLYEEVPREIIWDVASYGLPTRMSHWSFGRSYIHQKFYGEMGYSKIYELILNNNPSYAFLDDTNSDVVNLLICAHCYAHSDFFKNNACFAKTNRNMVNQAERNARIIDEYKEKYGVETVEDWMDIGFALERHIDPQLGEDRQKYAEPQHIFKEIQPLPYADLHGEDTVPRVVEIIRNEEFPPHREKDILWFLANYSQMFPWQREVLSLIRSESYYFYPQSQTKIMNEGWASYFHAEIMNEYENLTPAEHLEFSKAHSGVVSPGHGGSLNPYYVGFRILKDIKKRWDEYYEAGKNDAAFKKYCEKNGVNEMRDEDGKILMSLQTGSDKMFEVREQDDDVSFIQNYLTQELAEDMKLFTYGYKGETENPDEDAIILKSRELQKVKEHMTSKLHNYGMPPICIERADDKALHLLHEGFDETPLDDKYTKETLKYVQKLWRKPVILKTRDRFGRELKYKCVDGSVSTEQSKDGDSKRILVEL